MWGLLFESFAEAFGVTRRTRPLVFVVIVAASLGLSVLAFAERGPRGLFVLFLLLVLGAWSSLQVLRARTATWRAARLPLADTRQPPRPDVGDRELPPTVAALWRLARAVDEVRRGKFVDAADTLENLDRLRLRPDEERLLDGTRAMISLGLGDPHRAAQLAARALPTSSEDIDIHLGRALVSEAWSDPATLRTIDEGWAARGVLPGVRDALPRLRAIVRVRIETEAAAGLEAWEAKALADEARALGDETMAADLEARGRPTAYR